MAKRIVVSGTRTEVGKTWVAVALARALISSGENVSVRKPVQSFEPGTTTDAELLAHATSEKPYDVCPEHRWYPRALAPPMAAEALGLPPFSLGELIDELDLPRRGICLVEGIGGPRSPLADDADTVALAESLEADRIVLVSDPGLGALNDVLLATGVFAPRPVAVFLNRYDDANEIHHRNRNWLEKTSGLEVAVVVEDLVELLAEVR